MERVVIIVFIFSLIAHRFGVDGEKKVTITVLESAVAQGAVCLDGSPPSYAYSPGFGDGANNWNVYLQGGGWCWSSEYCFERSNTSLGSSTKLLNDSKGKISFDGMLENNRTFNLDFYNWNVVYVFYCDGSMFMSDVEEVDPVYNITYRGARIYNAIMEELLVRKGMRNAQNALLSGSSAGGLATILHCDRFRALFADNNTRVKCLSDSGFFIYGQELIGSNWREIEFFNVISTHGFANLLPKSCLTKFSPTLTVVQAVGDWFFDRSGFQEMDTRNEFPRNCSNTYLGQLSDPTFEEKCSHALYPNFSDASPKQLITPYFYLICVVLFVNVILL